MEAQNLTQTPSLQALHALILDGDLTQAERMCDQLARLQCQGCDVPNDGVYTIQEPAHSMSMYASKDGMLASVMRENEELRAKLVAESARTAEQKLRADQMTQQHGMQAKMHAQASAQLAAVQQSKG